MSDKKANEIVALASQLIQEANKLLREVIQDTEASDNRARSQKAHWTERHRLQVLLEAAEETQKSAPNTIVAPWFLAELAATLDIVRKWRQSPRWPDVEKSLKDKEAFDHTIAMLHVAEHLKMDGHNVQLVKEGLEPSPDLMLKASGGTQDMVVIECYQPAALRGKPSKLDSKEAESIIETSMKKARRQIGTDKPGIIAICGYNQSAYNLKVLRGVAEKRLSKTDRINFCGFWLIMLSVVLTRRKSSLSFQPARSAEFIRSPAYFGRVDIVDRVPTDYPNLIKSELTDITTDALISGNIKTELRHIEPSSPKEVEVYRTKAVKLKVVQEPEQLSRCIIHGRGSKVPPLFTGEGNINYQCAACGVTLAERVWKQSLSNIVIQCPACQSFNETTMLSLPDYPRVQITRGGYYFSDAVRLKSGRCLCGE